MSDGGKGSLTRPLSIPKNQFDKNWDVIFSKVKENVDKPKLNNEHDLKKKVNND